MKEFERDASHPRGPGAAAVDQGLLYRRVAAELRERIRSGVYLAGSRLPGVRRIAEEASVSLSTAIAAVRLLEDEGWIEARERSGFFVRRQAVEDTTDRGGADWRTPASISGQSVTLNLLRASSVARFGRLGVAMPDPAFLPVQPLQRAFRQTARWRSGDPVAYAFPPGLLALRQQVSRRLARAGCLAPPDRILITSGAQEAISLALRLLTRPGDIVAVESPTYYGLLQSMETLGLQVLEVPADPEQGIRLPALRLALERWPVKACVLVPNHSNPIGYAMPEERKRALAGLLDEQGVPLVEDDVYGELGFHRDRPRTVQSYMKGPHWFLVGSASKIVSAGLRLGWLVTPAAHQEQAEYLQYTFDAGASTLDQFALAEYLAGGGLDRHLRRVRRDYAELTARMAEFVVDRFPPGTRVNRPAGGYLLWVNGPETLDALELYRRAIAHEIAIAPGPLFSAAGRYRNCFRLNAAVPWDGALETALATLAGLAHQVVAAASSADAASPVDAASSVGA
ncbi:MAG TPA: PLP-dependent aminotransferase family protein, partial [Pseudomonadales bacterium]